MPALITSPISLKPKLSTLTFVTSNADKIREVTAICKEYGIRVEIVQSIDLPELQGSIEEVAREKCQQAVLAVSSSSYLEIIRKYDGKMLIINNQVNGPVLVEDSALIFHALNGLPGPYMCVALAHHPLPLFA
jgi:inosine triphosphate pyrophosphatase